MKCLIQFAQIHPEFRLPELYSVSKLYGISLALGTAKWGTSRPFTTVELNEEDALTLAHRCILVRSIVELYGEGTTYEDLHEKNKENAIRWQKYVHDTSFKFQIAAYNHSIPKERQREIMESFDYMDWKGAIDVNQPEVILTCIEEYPTKGPKTWKKYEDDGKFLRVYFGRLIVEGSARNLIQTFDVKKRLYFGNTSMDAEISLLMANQALAVPGKLVYDPFTGTGSMLYTAAHFGAFVFGSDIDGRQMRGKESIPGIIRSAEQYGVRRRVADLLTFDMAKHPWRRGGIFDAIVTDPPYGVRAGAKRLGRRERPEKSPKVTTLPGHLRPGYIPPTRPYELSELAIDLMIYARYLLKPYGRLVFFLPTVTDEYTEVDIPQCEGMSLISNSLQNFGTWGRRLLTVEKVTSAEFPPPAFDGATVAGAEDASHVPAHKDFREKYFAGFQKAS